ncbi:PQQ-dependent sugar dehydrogenase [Alkalihalophilus marmarensis]|jgi:glucose/arabinose dehydrogenase|uniref:Quinoprotein glucose dehydrogenase n=1 Tax=Alkalihalophilus marmarensis DSM 21297 TaxID=1188261 RepID=U6SS20_9BACI|nr:sorbosone dehydrogenase family protein [Alkalihalophilus marmarensis]ERN53431.1 quinoprotein glucose dehydrogenase [Alkalihalophilus marmarensis DSM 21297]MCM3490830.1 PQQ-dependent sugar dehydrogenase [Alkalihalophilus marmarensis]
MKRLIAVCIFLLIVGCSSVGCFSNEQEDSTAEQPDINEDSNHSEEEHAAGIEVIAENLEIPWSIEKADDTFYLTERPGSIIKVENGEMTRQDVQLEKNIATAAEAGLLGLVLAPDFSDSNLAFAYYTYEDNAGQFNRIVTLRLEDDSWREESLLLDQIPSGTYHHGGRLKIVPDETLYATAGDASAPDLAQDLNSLGGSILRMNLDGSIPEDNPLPDSYIYSYGHRNPQGLTWSSTGKLYSSEHGSSANDEINEIEGRQNYGWPIIQGTEKEEGMITPLFTSGGTDTWAPSGMDYANGKLYVAALRGEGVIEFDLETGEQRKVITDYGRIRDVLIEDDTLYFISNNTDGRGNPKENDDKLYKVSLTELIRSE